MRRRSREAWSSRGPGCMHVSRNRTVRIGVSADMSTRVRRHAALLALAIALSACGATASSSARPADSAAPSDSAPAPTAAPTASPEGLAHPTGATEIVLRADEAGGFVPVEWMTAHVPYFTLYGDGRVVFVSTSSTTEPRPDGVMTGMPIRTAVLSERQVQDLLVFALRDGGLAVARADYQNPMVADAPTTVFEIHADGDSKTVSIMALGMEGEPGPDTAIKAAFLKLAELLRDFDRGGSLGERAVRAHRIPGRAQRRLGRPGRQGPRVAVGGPRRRPISSSPPTRTSLQHADPGADARRGPGDRDRGVRGRDLRRRLPAADPTGRCTRWRCGRCCRTRRA